MPHRSGSPIRAQPGASKRATSSPSAFSGLLKKATSLNVTQEVELLEALIGWEQANRYTVRDQSGNVVFHVGEESSCCTRCCCQSARPFTLVVRDSHGRNLITMDRPLNCTCCFGACCADSMSVSTPAGQSLGSVREGCNILWPSFELQNAAGMTELKASGPICPISLGCGTVQFRIMNLAGAQIGLIGKEWAGLVREIFTDADYFSVSFPADLEPSMKAVCLAATFLIDFEYFEHNTRGDQGGRKLFG